MKPTIKNKLMGGFSGVLLLMGVVAAIGIWSVLNLRRSALETARVGDRLNAMSLEIQVHNLVAQRLATRYMLEVKTLGAKKGRQEYLDEADFEVHEIESLASKAVRIAPSKEQQEKFLRISKSATQYSQSLDAAAKSAESTTASATAAAYEQSAEQLNEDAEDGEMAGRQASQTSQTEIERISKLSVPLVIGISILGLVLALAACVILARAILIPVEHLRQVAEKVSLGELDISVHRYSDDEIGDLADSFSRMVTAVKFFRSDAQEEQNASAIGKGAGQ